MFYFQRKRKAFTLLEIIIVIIVIGVLASLALPRLFSMIEISRSAEAWMHITTIRSAAERCMMLHNSSVDASGCGNMQSLGLSDDVNLYSNYFIYNIAANSSGYKIIARYLPDEEMSLIKLMVDFDDNTVVKCGTGVFESIGTCP